MKRPVPITSISLRKFSRTAVWPYLRSISSGSQNSNAKRSCAGSAYFILAYRQTEKSQSGGNL